MEFLEALARAAEKFSPAPVVLAVNDKLLQNYINNISTEQLKFPNASFFLSAKALPEEEMPWEERNEQPLHKKIENLIRIIFY